MSPEVMSNLMAKVQRSREKAIEMELLIRELLHPPFSLYGDVYPNTPLKQRMQEVLDYIEKGV